MTKTMRVVGSRGFVGSAIVRAARGRGFDVMEESLDKAPEPSHPLGTNFLVNAAMPSRRYWAEQYPHQDFHMTVYHTWKLVEGRLYGKLVQVSSLSARCQRDTVYGRHKLAAEALVEPADLVVRLGPMFGRGLTKGALFEIARDGDVWVSDQSRYACVDVDWAAAWIIDHLDVTGVIEVGAKEPVTLGELAAEVGSRCTFVGDYVDHQEPMQLRSDVRVDGPPARDVIPWILDRRKETAP